MKFKKFWKTYLVTFVISSAIGAGIFCAFYFSGGRTPLASLNGSGFSAVIMLCLALLMFVAREGFFDFAAYGFKQMGAMIFTKQPSQYNDFPGYKEYKVQQRKFRSHYYVIILIVSALLFVTYIALRLVYKDLY